MSTMQTRVLKGHQEVGGGQLVPAEMTVSVTLMGQAHDPLTGEALTVRRREFVTGQYEEVIGNGVWLFVPKEGECDRCGIVVDYQA